MPPHRPVYAGHARPVRQKRHAKGERVTGEGVGKFKTVLRWQKIVRLRLGQAKLTLKERQRGDMLASLAVKRILEARIGQVAVGYIGHGHPA